MERKLTVCSTKNAYTERIMLANREHYPKRNRSKAQHVLR